MSSALPFKVKAVYEYNSPHEDDLGFPNGQIITVTEEEDADWYVGEYTDAAGAKQEGLFPRNFVERYEPPAPPRPTRARPKKEPAAPAEPEPVAPSAQPVDEPAQVETTQDPPKSPAISKPDPPAAVLSPTKPTEEKTVPPTPAAAARSVPPPVAEKPSSFKDRIAAFNKASAQPIAPVKPGPPAGSSSSTSFIKKPFVAPPPSRDAYVAPPTREQAPQKVYRREEDPEIVERQAQDLEDAEKAGLATAEGHDGEEEEAAKPTSLRDRIALLQKQQQEQAARRADVGQKEKPKRPPKKRTESGDAIAAAPEDEHAESEQRPSSDIAREPPPRAPAVRRPSRDPKSSTQDIISDGNEADQSGAGDTTEEAEAEETEVEDVADRSKSAAPAPLGRTSTSASRAVSNAVPERITAGEMAEEPEEQDGDDDNDDQDEEEEDDGLDEEARRKLALRERMAKMSGGMGMPGMFAMPMPGVAPKKKRPSGSSEQRAAVGQEQAASPPQGAPMVPIPGMSKPQSPESTQKPLEVEREPEAGLPTTPARDPQVVPDVEDLEQQPSSGARLESRAAPPVPQGNRGFRWSPQKASRDSRREALLKSRSTVDLHARRTFTAYDGASGRLLTSEGFKRSLPPLPPSGSRAPPPPVPGSRPVPQAPTESRPVPPPPPRSAQSPGPGSESDDDLQDQEPTPQPLSRATTDLTTRAAPPPVPGAPSVPQRPEGPRSPPTSAKRTSYMDDTNQLPLTSPSAASEKRASRAVPPVPTAAPTMLPGPPSDVRPPPPPPPTAAPPTRQSTGSEIAPQPNDDDVGSDGESDYEGDYDTDIAAGATHKNALKSHAREPSLDESTLSEATPPPVPLNPTRGVPPPPPPHQYPPDSRQSADASRAPPPIPRSAQQESGQDDADYDPFRYSNPAHGIQLPTHRKTRVPIVPLQEDDPAFYGESPQRSDRAPPPPPQSPPQSPPQPVPGSSPNPGARQSREVPRQSMETRRTSMNAVRMSTDPLGPTSEHGQIAQDVDLSQDSVWWATPNRPPPVFENRPDVLCEFEESAASKRGGRTTISKDVYVLFQDYSQTVITARFDSKVPSDVSLEQRHESPPSRPRQDQLEQAHGQFGERVGTAANAKQNQTIGNGTAQAFVLDVVKAQQNALLPIGTRAYGALIYANMANATVQQYDEIRPGDIISFRNAKFSGKHGAMHAKYNEDVGKPEHVGVVVEWDGTKKKVRALEQGRESKKVKVESFRVGDLRSGEVKVWRVMGRNWVGWESS